MVFIDISVTVEKGIPIWTDSIGASYTRAADPEKTGGYVTVSHFKTDVHTGTHIDAPRHFVPDGKTIEAVPLDKLIGRCYVADLSHHPQITAKDLENAGIPQDVEKLLLKTDNSKKWLRPLHEFDTDYCALTKDAADWVVRRGIHLIGIDYLSIQLYHGSDDTHINLLKNEVVILETVNLLQTDPGYYNLICLPPKIKGLEGMPVRAVLQTLED